MALTVTLLERITVGGITTDKTQAPSAGAGSSVSESIPDSSTDLNVGFNLDFSACKFFYINSDQDITVETNNGTTPDDTLTLLANVPYIWHVNSNHTFLIGTDITALFVTNASGSAALLTIEEIHDPTP